MSDSSPETFKDPLPKRFREVAEKRRLLEEGIVLKPNGFRTLDFYDIANACQAIVIERLSADLIQSWETPQLPGELPFHQDFAVLYYKDIFSAEGVLWRQIVQDVVSDPTLDLNNLSSHEAAVLTLSQMNGFENWAASSQELFVELALHAEVYERLLREREDSAFDLLWFYDLLQQKMSKLMKRLIALDSVIIDYYRANVMDRSSAVDPDKAEYYKSPLDPKFFIIDDNFELRPHPKLIALFRELATKEGATEDSLGRNENRGCPFLRTQNQDDLIDFAISEFITQHQRHFGVKTN